MLDLLILVLCALTLALRGHRELVLENLALRQQLAVYHRTTRCRLRARDRLFWIALAQGWRNWRTALVFVQPDTVVRWHRDWLRRRWTRRSKRRPEGRPRSIRRSAPSFERWPRRTPYGARRGFMGSCGRSASTFPSIRYRV